MIIINIDRSWNATKSGAHNLLHTHNLCCKIPSDIKVKVCHVSSLPTVKYKKRSHKKIFARFCKTCETSSVCAWAECDVYTAWSRSKDGQTPVEQTQTGLTPAPPSSTAPLWRPYGFLWPIFGLYNEEFLIISLEWTIRTINNQVCVCQGVSVVWVQPEWRRVEASQPHMKVIEGAARRISAKYPEKYSSKWGVPRPTVPLINTLTPSVWRARSRRAPHVSPFGTQMWTFTSEHTSRHLSQQSR